MKKKTAKRFLKKNKWRIAEACVQGWRYNLFCRDVAEAVKISGDLSFFKKWRDVHGSKNSEGA